MRKYRVKIECSQEGMYGSEIWHSLTANKKSSSTVTKTFVVKAKNEKELFIKILGVFPGAKLEKDEDTQQINDNGIKQKKELKNLKREVERLEYNERQSRQGRSEKQ